MAKHHFKPWEDKIIKEDWQTHTDKEIAKKVGRTEEAIARRRKHLGLIKTNGRPLTKTRKNAILGNPTEYTLSQLNKDDRLEFYKAKFEEHFRYPILKATLFKDELIFYRHKYIEFLDQVDTISLTEEDLLDKMIMTEIQIIRIQRQIKEELDRYYADDDEDKRPPPQYLYKDLNDAEERYIKYQQKLNVTREQRLKMNKEEKINVSTLVRAFMDKKNRHEGGKLAGQMSYFADRCKEDMSKMKFLLGGE